MVPRHSEQNKQRGQWKIAGEKQRHGEKDGRNRIGEWVAWRALKRRRQERTQVGGQAIS